MMDGSGKSLRDARSSFQELLIIKEGVARKVLRPLLAQFIRQKRKNSYQNLDETHMPLFKEASIISKRKIHSLILHLTSYPK